MEKMIKVINDNLRTVINGIKSHKASTENSLTIVKEKMDERVQLASEYRSNVEESRQTISSLENEISTLENDLNDLKNKFGSKDFKELLVVGSKEINNKIVEKKSLIAQQSQKIVALTDKAHRLKNELVSLKEKRLALEATLEKDHILEGYYESKIMEIIDFSEAHVEDLQDYIETEPQESLISSSNEDNDVDITNVIDGSIFEEIDEISNSSDIDELSNYINEQLDDGDIDLSSFNIADYDDIEEGSGEAHDDDATVTLEIDDIINQANDLLEKSKSIEESLTNDEGMLEPVINNEEDAKEETKPIETIKLDDVNPVSTPVNADEEDDDEGEGLTLNLKDDEEETEPEEEPEISEVPPVDDIIPVFEPEGINEDDHVEEDEIGAIGKLRVADDTPEEETEPESEKEPETTEEEIDENDVVDEENMFEALESFNPPTDNNDEEVIVSGEESIEDKRKELVSEMEEANLTVSKFLERDFNNILDKYVKNNVLNVVYTLRKHNIAITKLYECANLLTMQSEEVDYILNLLEKTNASSEAISYVCKLLDRIDIYKLEDRLSSKTDYELADLLYEVIPYVGDIDLAMKFDLNSEELGILKSSTTKDEYEKMNEFSDIVLANYKELKKYNVNNLNECLTKHPHRFLLNPDNFAAILDKYDPEDLTRCVNKNSAVIDKL